MKKILFTILVSVFTLQVSVAQVKIGFKFSPNIAFASIVDRENNDLFRYDNQGATVRYSTGANLDFFFGENYAFSTGLWYTVRNVGLDYTRDTTAFKSRHNLKYLQVPLTIKAYSNEFVPGIRAYFQFGGTLDYKVGEKIMKWEALGRAASLPTPNDRERFFLDFDATLLLGAGVRYQLGESTFATAGVSYNRGLINAIRKDLPIDRAYQAIGQRSKANVFTQLVSLDLGIFF
jgi:hypothetical protein